MYRAYEYQQELLEEYAHEILKLNIALLKHTRKLEELLLRMSLRKNPS